MSWQNIVWCLCFGLFVRWFINLAFNPTPMDGGFDLQSFNATNLPTQHTQNRRGEQVLAGNAPFLMNWLKEGQEYDVDVYMSTMEK